MCPTVIEPKSLRNHGFAGTFFFVARGAHCQLAHRARLPRSDKLQLFGFRMLGRRLSVPSAVSYNSSKEDLRLRGRRSQDHRWKERPPTMPRYPKHEDGLQGAQPVVTDDPPKASGAPPRKRRFARWRALSLSLVYVVFGVHIAHWKITGKTLAPLELNEVMYTLELGIITAGFIFMCMLVVGSLLFGRFFCSWACHIMVLQELCAWLLRKMHIRPKQMRSRLLLFVPPVTALYMFVWPQILRAWHDKALPTFHIAGDAEGWASFATTNFWRNLPGPWILALTFVVCGFAVVYILGSRSFCTYVCPYGAVFGLADRFSMARIRVSDACRQCGQCTAGCSSGVRVHEEVHKHGMIVNPACLKDLDCIATCPQGALSYGLARPALFKSFKSGGRFGLPFDFTLSEELLAAIAFLATVLCFRGLYGRIPFLLSLACGAIVAYMTVILLQLPSRVNVTVGSRVLKRQGRLTRSGWAFTLAAAAFAVFYGHCGMIRYHEYFGLRGVRAAQQAETPDQAERAAERARQQLTLADRWGLFVNPTVERGLFVAATALGDSKEAESLARRLLVRQPHDAYILLTLARTMLGEDRRASAEAALQRLVDGGRTDDPKDRPMLVAAHELLGRLYAERGSFEQAVPQFRSAVDLQPGAAHLHAKLGGALAELRRLDEAVAQFEQAITLDPALYEASYNLGTLLMYQGRFDDAVRHLTRAMPGYEKDADAHNNLGLALARMGSWVLAERHLNRAVELAPDHADAHFNLARLLLETDRLAQAQIHLTRAAELDTRYRDLLRSMSQ